MRKGFLLLLPFIAVCNDLPCPGGAAREGCSCPRGGRWRDDTGWWDSGGGDTGTTTGPWHGHGSEENDRLFLSSHAAQIRGAHEGDGFGAAVAATTDRDGDGLAELLVGAPDAGDGGGDVYVVDGGDLVDGGQTAPNDELLAGDPGDALGYAVADAGDLDGDGTTDLAFGAPGRADRAGAVLIVTGDATIALVGENADDYAGGVLAPAGDVDGDGLGDLLVGAWGTDLGGAAYLASGAALTDGASLLDVGGMMIYQPGAHLGSALAGGADFDGDGLPEAVVAAPDADESRGIVWVKGGGFDADLDGLQAEIHGDDPSDWLGDSVAVLPDVDGDGTPELLVGVPGDDERGRDAGGAVIVPGAAIAAGGTVTARTATLSWTVDGGWAGMSTGGGDGWGVVGVPADDTLKRDGGAVWLVPWAEGDELYVEGSAGTLYYLDERDAHAALSLATLGDLGGDDGVAFAAGAPGFDNGRGAVYVVP